jgi:hypothetical protein
LSSTQFLLLFDALFLGAGAFAASQGRTVPALSIFAAFGIFAVWQIGLASTVLSFAHSYRWESSFRPTHYVQAALHTTIYSYLGLYWDGIARYAPLIVTQIIFGYLFDMLMAWTRGRVWRAGLGVVPIVLSTNLFLWFRESSYYLQLLLMALTFLGKEFVTWNYDGRRRHIFNPSAFSLSIVSVLLLATNTVDLTHAVDIAAAFDVPPNYYEVIFLLGLVVQGLFIVTPVSFGAALAMYVIFLVSRAIYGEPLSPSVIQTAVFLGMTFLVTDPATSPRTHFGRFLFGLTYGAGVIASFVLLRLAHEPAIFDKLLIVPVVNLLVPPIDRLCARLARTASGSAQAVGPGTSQIARFGWLAVYIVLIAIMLPTLKEPRTVRPTLLPPPAGNVSDDVLRTMQNMIYCRSEFPAAYEPFGFRSEFANLATIRKIYRSGPSARDRGPRGDVLPDLR